MRLTQEQAAALRAKALKNARYADGTAVARHDVVMMASPLALGGTGVTPFGRIIGGHRDGLQVEVEQFGDFRVDTYHPWALRKA